MVPHRINGELRHLLLLLSVLILPPLLRAQNSASKLRPDNDRQMSVKNEKGDSLSAPLSA